VLGHTGAITLEAIRWLTDVGAGYLQVDEDGRVLAAFGPDGADRPGLRRSQAGALDTSLGNETARQLVSQKIAAQVETLAGFPDCLESDVSMQTLADAAERLRVAVTRDDIRLAEAMAAGGYWAALASSPVGFARRDETKVPRHWHTFGVRTSPLTGSPRLAANPANALLNYTYALLESEATLAARLVGLDPGLGVLHADQMNRASLAADLMEPVRPYVDLYVLMLLARRTFAVRDFYETRHGVCRVTPGLAHELAQTLPAWRARVGIVAEDVARILGGDDSDSRRLATPLSERNRSSGRGVASRRPTGPRSPNLTSACEWCGGPVRPGRRTCSGPCLAGLEGANRPAFVRAGVEALTKLRASGWKRQLTTEGRARIGSNGAKRSTAPARAWQRDHPWPTDMGAFTREILPGLQQATARELSAATGLSPGYCRRIMKGEVVPHPMWWTSLDAFAGGEISDE
jgi:CRISPR-associated endonuclease Cas1